MKKEDEVGKITGGGLFFFAKKMVNNGKLISTGDLAQTVIVTDDYKGKGTVESHTKKESKVEWLKGHIIQLLIGTIVTVLGGLILFYVFGIGKV